MYSKKYYQSTSPQSGVSLNLDFLVVNTFAGFRKIVIIYLVYIHSFLVISEDCKVYEISFDLKNGGECKKESEASLDIF